MDNEGRDYCRVCGRMLEDGIICESCKKKYQPNDKLKINKGGLNKWQQIKLEELQK